MDDRTASDRQTVRERYFEPEGCWIGEWWNNLGDSAVSIAYVRVEPGRTTRLHRLRGIFERYLILSGIGRAEIGRQSAREVGAGEVIVIPPGTAQRIANTGVQDLVFLAVCTPRFRAEAYEQIAEAGPVPDERAATAVSGARQKSPR